MSAAEAFKAVRLETQAENRNPAAVAGAIADLTLVQIDKYQMLPCMTPDQFDALKADIADRSVLVPIDVDEHGHILDGHHRYRACVELGITDFPTIVRPGMTEEGRRIFARKSNMLRRHLTREQVRQLIVEQLKDTPSWADRRIGQELGVDHKTVAEARARLLETGEIPQFEKLVGIWTARSARPSQPARLPSWRPTSTNWSGS